MIRMYPCTSENTSTLQMTDNPTGALSHILKDWVNQNVECCMLSSSWNRTFRMVLSASSFSSSSNRMDSRMHNHDLHCIHLFPFPLQYGSAEDAPPSSPDIISEGGPGVLLPPDNYPSLVSVDWLFVSSNASACNNVGSSEAREIERNSIFVTTRSALCNHEQVRGKNITQRMFLPLLELSWFVSPRQHGSL